MMSGGGRAPAALAEIAIGEGTVMGSKTHTRVCFHDVRCRYEKQVEWTLTRTMNDKEIAALLLPTQVQHPLRPHFELWHAKGFHPDQKAAGKYNKVKRERPDSSSEQQAQKRKRKRQKFPDPIVPNAVPRVIPDVCSGAAGKRNKLSAGPEKPFSPFDMYMRGPTMAASGTVNVVVKAVMVSGMNRAFLQEKHASTHSDNLFPMMGTTLLKPRASISHPVTGQVGQTGATTLARALLALHIYVAAATCAYEDLAFFLYNFNAVNYTVRADVGGPVDLDRIVTENAQLPEDQQLIGLEQDKRKYPGLHWPIHRHIVHEEVEVYLDGAPRPLPHSPPVHSVSIPSMPPPVDDGYDSGAESLGDMRSDDDEDGNGSERTSSAAMQSEDYITQIIDDSKLSLSMPREEKRSNWGSDKKKRSRRRSKIAADAVRRDRPHAMLFARGPLILVGLRSIYDVTSAMAEVLPVVRKRAHVDTPNPKYDNPRASTILPASEEMFRRALLKRHIATTTAS